MLATFASLAKVEDRERAWNYYIKPQMQRRLRVCHAYHSTQQTKNDNNGTEGLSRVKNGLKMDSKMI